MCSCGLAVILFMGCCKVDVVCVVCFVWLLVWSLVWLLVCLLVLLVVLLLFRCLRVFLVTYNAVLYGVLCVWLVCLMCKRVACALL